MMYRIFFLLALSATLFTSCDNEVVTVDPDLVIETNDDPLQLGTWRMTMDISATEQLPFMLELIQKGENLAFEVINHNERIEVNDVTLKGDSIFVRMPFFDSEFKGKISSPTSFSGYWFNFNKGVDYKIPFRCQAGSEDRFSLDSEDLAVSLSGKWEVTFSPGTDGEYKAIGSFEQFGTHLSGTFITETGDYRFLEGVGINDSLYLSCFDGSHAFLFKAALNDEKVLEGQFWSGKHWQEPWTASLNSDFTLRDPDSLTYLKSGFDKLEFSFPDLDNNIVSLSDEKYNDKVIIVQIMGSWCPNCLDETELYVDLHRQYNNSGLEIISLAYEASENFDEASANVRRLRDNLSAEYDFLIAGVANKKKASETLPMLNHVMSYPTSIFIDRSGNIRRIHTGFYGPGTGAYYDDYVNDLTSFLEEMMAE